MGIVQNQPIHKPDGDMFFDDSLNEKLEDLLSYYEGDVWFIIKFSWLSNLFIHIMFSY